VAHPDRPSTNERAWIHLQEEINAAHNVPNQRNSTNCPEASVNTTNVFIIHHTPPFHHDRLGSFPPIGKSVPSTVAG